MYDLKMTTMPVELDGANEFALIDTLNRSEVVIGAP